MGKFIDITGQRFGRWTVIEKLPEKFNDGTIKWKAQCDCGTIREVRAKDLRYGKSVSCGCYKREKTSQIMSKDITGQRFGKLIAIRSTEENKNGHKIWECKCDCGKIHYTTLNNLQQGYTTSCGCINSQGENKIKQLLDDLQILYIQQFYFLDCRNPKTNCVLYFDFYLPDYNCCIEYNGEQHYIARKKGIFTQDKVNEIRYRDQIKKQYCQDNNIPLIEIPYTDYNLLNKNYILQKVGDL